MQLKKMIEEKKAWQSHMKRVKKLPKDYQIVYKESQKYLFKVAPMAIAENHTCLIEILDLFEEGANEDKSVLEITGTDIAAFCDEFIDKK